jgi:c-di-GMP-binding flagellar brake protein YcgR
MESYRGGMGRDESSDNLLADAIARNLAAVLSLPSAGMLRHCKSRFLAECDEGVWIESAADQRPLIDQLISTAQPAVVSFKTGTNKVSFAAKLVRRDEQFRLNAEQHLEAVLMARPREVKAVQRRNDYRVRLASDDETIQARLWRIAEHAVLRDRPMASQEFKVTPRDLSLGGLGVIITPRTKDEPVRLLANERMRIELRYNEQELLLEGRVRHIPPLAPDGTVRVGVQFKKLENDMEGRQAMATLTKIVGTLQREEVRRMRLGLAKAG